MQRNCRRNSVSIVACTRIAEQTTRCAGMNGELARRAQIVCDDDIAKAIPVYVAARERVGIDLLGLGCPECKQRARRPRRAGLVTRTGR